MQDDISAVYDELRALAAFHLRRGLRSPSLQATQLVHEAWLRLANKHDWRSKTHFMATASRTMRNVLIDAARARFANKRGSGQVALEITPGIELRLADLALPLEQLIVLDQALDRLAEEDARKARVVEMRFFGGMEFTEIAEALEVSLVTVKRDWQFSRAWLAGQLNAPPQSSGISDDT